MGEKLQDMVGASSCTTSNAGMSTDRGSDEQDGSRHMTKPVSTRLGVVLSIWNVTFGVVRVL